eukprot:SAG31_NODE_4093_length_3598_cov_1.740211_3_plen_137_part_00
MHLPRSALQKQFPSVNYRSFVEADKDGEDYVDSMFVAGETDAGILHIVILHIVILHIVILHIVILHIVTELSQRAYNFLCWIANRSENDIAVVCHSKFLFAMLVSAIDTAEPSLRSWFGTGEVIKISYFLVFVPTM